MQTLLEYIQNDLVITELEQICEGLELNESLSELKEKAAEKIKSLKPKYAAAIKNFLEKAKSKGQKTLIGALTLISLIGNVNVAKADISSDSLSQFADDYMELYDMQNATKPENDVIKLGAHNKLDVMLLDDEYNYFSGYGESTEDDKAFKLAEEAALQNYKQLTGKDAKNYKFKYIPNLKQSSNKKLYCVVALLMVAQ